MEEMRQKEVEKGNQKNKIIKESEEHLKLLDKAVENEKQMVQRKKHKFMEFDFKNQRKAQWFEKNIIVP
jgi:hypothetical protein